GIVSGKLRLERKPCDLVALIRAALDTALPEAVSKRIDMSTDLDPSTPLAYCDPGRMQQAVWNLLANAVKFTPDGGRVLVTLKREESGLRIAVTDNGKGIPPELLPFIFERFRQEEGSFRGLGLGLSIVKHIVEVHGGTVYASSIGEGRGSTFVINLPIQAIAIPPGDDASTTDGNDARFP